MSRQNGHVPAYRLHKASGQARAILNHQHVYLGKYGSAESREKDSRLISEMNANGDLAANTTAGTSPRLPFSVDELILDYWRFANTHFVKDGKPTATVVLPDKAGTTAK